MKTIHVIKYFLPNFKSKRDGFTTSCIFKQAIPEIFTKKKETLIANEDIGFIDLSYKLQLF